MPYLIKQCLKLSSHSFYAKIYLENGGKND